MHGKTHAGPSVYPGSTAHATAREVRPPPQLPVFWSSNSTTTDQESTINPRALHPMWRSSHHADPEVTTARDTSVTLSPSASSRAPIMRRGQHVHRAHIRPGVGLDVDPDWVHKHEQGHHTKSDQQLQRQDTWDAHAIRRQGRQASTQSAWHQRRGSAGRKYRRKHE